MQTMILPQIRPLASSGRQLLGVMRDLGLGYRTQDFYADLRSPPAEYAYPTYQTTWTEPEAVYHEAGLYPFRYEVQLAWRDPEGEYEDEEGETWHRAYTSVWADKPTPLSEVLQTLEDEYEAGEKQGTDPYVYETEDRGFPETVKVSSLHVYAKRDITLQPFQWR